jgi:hypothetical protein
MILRALFSDAAAPALGRLVEYEHGESTRLSSLWGEGADRGASAPRA